ncbi:MAG TPA: hypothetical protein VME47_02255 [Acetobacteraceae bacterium]|nr:hypothetical protein [Acetobacteraceae bacterium]
MARQSDSGIGMLGLAALGLVAALAQRRDPRHRPAPPHPRRVAVARSAARAIMPATPSAADVPAVSAAHIKAARRLNNSAGMLAASVLADSAVEHYRGSFHNPAMYAPLLSSLLTLAVSAHGVGDTRSGRHAARDAIYALAGLTGTVGTCFHLYNVTKRPGGVSWLNLFFGAPLGAPFALALAGLLGVTAERVRGDHSGRVPNILGLPAGRAMAAVSGIGMLGTTAEASLLHFRGAYHNPAMFLPVTVPPVAAALLGETALGRPATNRWVTRWWLRLTASLGFIGAALHALGVARAMGGWRNWRQNVVDGPPLPAPPSFTALALAGLAALRLLRDQSDD